MEAVMQSEQEFINAKAYLLGTSTTTELNLYDHLAAVLTTILDERPDNVVDIFEELSHHQKQTKFTSDVDTVQDKIDKSTEVALAQIQEKLFKKGDGEGDEQDMEQEDMESPLPNLMETAYFFEQAGIGLNREELVRIWLSLKDLNDSKPLQHIRFWGKIFGVEQSYVVAEVEYREGEEEEVEEEEEAEEKEDEEAADRDEDAEDDEETEEDVIPKPDYKPPPKVPREEYRQGTNKKTYFVCNEAGKPWTRLPNVTPEQITGARKMKKFFTGRLDAPVICYPPFPGNESNYLRAQIARISAGTQISPLNFYTFEEDEDMDEEVGRDEFSKNPDFEEIPVRDLVDPSLGNWVHHVLHILPQGRCNWWNPVQKNEEEFEDEDEDEERDEPDEPVPETGPHLLTPLSEDAELDSMPAWTAKLSSNLILQYSVAIIHSNLWPGSHAFCDEKKFENIYIGYGHKYSAQTFSPQAAPQIQEEFPSGPEITEVDDPTPEEEAALQAAKIEAAEAAEEVEEGEEDEDEDD